MIKKLIKGMKINNKIFYNFSKLLESVFCPKLKKKHFLKNQINFFWLKKYFSLTNFYNDKQT
jgi:hypothetical protein